ncbi:MAG: leucine-rich repeat domain-containing protein, partial [Clostridiales bacterium]|nr:leucine-rich repeat domain-containing protein [Clostridiales bacterium]
SWTLLNFYTEVFNLHLQFPVNFSSTITAIDSYCFYNTKITTIEIPETVTSIGTRAFANCTFLYSATMYNANCTFSGDPFNGSNQSVTMYGYSSSTTQNYAESYSYTFVSIDECDHETTYEEVVTEPTCTETGLTNTVCAECGFIVAQTVTAATSHTYELTDSEDLSESDGHIYSYYTCTVCGEEYIKIEHSLFMDGYYETTVIRKASCTSTGLERYTCSICGETKTSIISKGHTVESYTVTVEPTCTATGTTYYACTNCTNTKVEYTDALGHDYVVDENNSVAPTCTTAGYNKYNCSRCSAAKTETVSATGHTAVEDSIVIFSEATCTEDGLATAECSVCGESYEMTIAATGHDYVDVETEIEDKPGHVLSTPVCSVCGATSTATTIHQEWIEGYYTTTVITEGSYTVARVTRDTCDLCG